MSPETACRQKQHFTGNQTPSREKGSHGKGLAGGDVSFPVRFSPEIPFARLPSMMTEGLNLILRQAIGNVFRVH